MSAVRAAAPALIGLLATVLAAPVSAREPGDPIAMKWKEGDVSGFSRILSADGKQTLGFVEFHQSLRGNVLKMVRIARFADGSSDEDHAEAKVGKTLETLSGRSIIRDTRGRETVDLKIDVKNGRVTGTTGLGDEQEKWDEKMDLTPGTYFGPLIFVVLKSFDANAADNTLTFNTVAVTPKPRFIAFEVTRGAESSLSRPGGKIKTQQYTLKPSVNFLIDPIIQRIAPATDFFIQPSSPPALARFAGPRNYEGQMIRIE